MSSQVTPEVLWAQRSSDSDPEKNYIYLTISVPDVSPKSLKLNLTPTSLVFTGTSETKKTTYHVELEFYAEIDPENSKTHHTAANIQLILRKKELTLEYWPRLLKGTKKVHFLRTDFDKWVDEDEQNEAPEDDYLNQFGGGGLGEDGGFGGIDFSKLGGAAGLGGDAAASLGGLGGGEAEDEDDEMPDLEGEEGEEGKEEGKEGEEGKEEGKEGEEEGEGKGKAATK